jgi:hypothetical protein
LINPPADESHQPVSLHAFEAFPISFIPLYKKNIHRVFGRKRKKNKTKKKSDCRAAGEWKIPFSISGKGRETRVMTCRN